MALTRKMLKAMGIEDEKIDEIIEAHTETVDGLKADRDKFKDNASKLEKVQKELDDANAKLEKNGKLETVSKEEFEKIKKEYEDYKTDIEAKQTKTKKENAFRELLKEAGVSEKRIKVVMKASALDIDGLELGEDGKIKDADKRTENIKTEWADFIETDSRKGADTSHPPKGGAEDSIKKYEEMSMKEYMEARSKKE